MTVAVRSAKKTNPSAESGHVHIDAYGHVANENYAGDGARTAAETYVYNPEGRASSVTSSEFGVQADTYDAGGAHD